MPKIEVTLKLQLHVEDQAETDYYLETSTNTPTANFIADIFDEFEDSFTGILLTVNDLSKEDIAKKLQEEIV